VTLTCPICGRGSLSAETYSDEIRHNDQTLVVSDLEGSRCDTCNADPVLTEQIKRNQIRISDAKRRADGLLASADIKAIRERLRLSQPEAAALFGGGANAFSKYERGEVAQSVPMDRLMRAVAAFPFLVEFLRAASGSEVSTAHAAGYTAAQNISLNDPAYTSKPVVGEHVAVSSMESQSVVSLTDWRSKKVA
jgi:HTH-type transcriptional regulator / antitoxin MqsA